MQVVAKAIGTKAKDGSSGLPSSSEFDPIGSTRTFAQRRMASYRKTVLSRGGSQEDIWSRLTQEQLVEYNPRLRDHTPQTRLAYAKFKSLGMRARAAAAREEEEREREGRGESDGGEAAGKEEGGEGFGGQVHDVMRRTEATVVQEVSWGGKRYTIVGTSRIFTARAKRN